MIERKLFQEIPGGKNQFHSAVLTSFSFNFHHFEYQVLKELRRKWITSVTVLADQNMLDDLLGVASDHLKELSQSYCVIGRKAKGAFHPKINFFIGDDKILVFFGSGNITPGGHGKNHELFTGFYADKENKTQLPLIIECWNYIKHLAIDIEGYPKQHLFDTLPNTCDLLISPPSNSSNHTFLHLDETTDIALLYNEQSSIFGQIATLVPSKDINKITIVSPYYDSDGQSLINLLTQFPNASLDAYLPSDFGLPPVNLKDNKSINFYAWEATNRGKKTITAQNEYKRKLHSKIFHFQSDKYEYCLLGSANATVPGLGSLTIKPLNEEFGALYRSSKKGFLSKLGIIGPKKKVYLSDFNRVNINTPITEESTHKIKKVTITNVDCFNQNFKVHFSLKVYPFDGFIAFFDSQGILITELPINLSTNELFIIKLSEIDICNNPVYITFLDAQKNPCSNKQLINFINKLLNTDPSKGNRNIRQIINSISCGQLNEFEIIELINNIQSRSKEKNIPQQKGHALACKDNILACEMTYQEAIAAAVSHEHHEIVIGTYSSTQLWESLVHLFELKNSASDEQTMDEEEEAKTDRSRDRNRPHEDTFVIVIKDTSQAHRMMNRLNKMIDTYLKNIESISFNKDHKIGIIDLSEFLLISQVLTSVCNFSHFKFNKPDEEAEWKKQTHNIFLHSMIDILENFAKLWIKVNGVEQPKNEYEVNRLEQYIEQAKSHIFISLFLIDRINNSEFIRQKLELISINLLHFMGLPNQNFNQYINNIISSLEEHTLSADNIITLKERFCDKFNILAESHNYFIFDHSGICQIIETTGNKYEYISLFNKGQIHPNDFKKLRIN
jgi:hypothetical protein